MSSTYIHPTNPSPKLAVVLEFFDSITSYSVETFSKPLSESLIHQILPASLNHPAFTKAEFVAVVKERVWGVFQNMKFNIIEVVEEGDGPNVVVHTAVDPSAVTAAGASYAMEYIFILKLAQEGPSGEWKITSIKEFMDSLFFAKFTGAI